MTELYLDHLDTPTGPLAIVADKDGVLRALGWRATHDRMNRQLERYAKEGTTLVPTSDPGGLTTALRAYFAGDLHVIDAIPALPDGTEFQQKVWRALRDIPNGETRSYLELARAIGNPAAVRAVGLANGANPIGIVIPCHRVIGANGSLTGYGGGIERKRWLLSHERAPGHLHLFVE